MANLLVIGAGVMGTAITVPAIKNGHDITLVGTPLDKEIIEKIKTSKIHPNLNIKIENTGVGESWRFGTFQVDIQPDGRRG